jgi:hypothetical protein
MFTEIILSHFYQLRVIIIIVVVVVITIIGSTALGVP